MHPVFSNRRRNLGDADMATGGTLHLDRSSVLLSQSNVLNLHVFVRPEDQLVVSERGDNYLTTNIPDEANSIGNGLLVFSKSYTIEHL
jgi:hypothetical protein